MEPTAFCDGIRVLCPAPQLDCNEHGGTANALSFVRSSLFGLELLSGHEPLRLTEARSGARVCDPQQGWFMGGCWLTAVTGRVDSMEREHA